MSNEATATAEPAQRAPLDDLRPDARPSSTGDINLDVVLDIPVTLSLEVGRSQISIRNLLQLNQGSVMELDRATSDRGARPRRTGGGWA